MAKLQINTFIHNFDLKKYIDSHHIKYKETSSDPIQYIFHECPFCHNINYKGNIHPNRFYISSENKQFVCFNCNERGNLFKFLSKIEDLTFKEIFNKYLLGEYFESLPKKLELLIEDIDKENEEVDQKAIELPPEFEPIYPFNAKFKEVYKYIKNRGFLDLDIFEKLDLRYCEYLEIPKEDGRIFKLYKRLIFPIKFNGQILGYQGRDITGLSPVKYYISEGFKKQKMLYNYDNVKDAEYVTIVEGIVDLIKCINHNPICLFGKVLSKKQLNLLHEMKNLKTIVVAIDPDTKVVDENGRSPYMDLINILKDFWEVREVSIPEDKDAGDHSIEQMDSIINKAIPFSRKMILINGIIDKTK